MQTDRRARAFPGAMARAALTLVFALLACRAHDAPPKPAAAPAPVVQPSPAIDPATIDDAQIDADVATIVGGNYAVDHLGPKVYDAIEARVAAAPARYARGVMRKVEALTGDPRLGDLHFAALLARLYAKAPDETSAAAAFVLVRAGWMVDERPRQIGSDRPLLESIAGGIDRPWSADWAKVVPDRLCAAPTPDGQGLRVELGCTCGEVPVCRAELDGNRVHVRVRLDATKPKRCFDCYPGHSTCTLPKLAPNQRLQIDVDGVAHGELIAEGGGWLPPGVCLSKG